MSRGYLKKSSQESLRLETRFFGCLGTFSALFAVLGPSQHFLLLRAQNAERVPGRPKTLARVPGPAQPMSRLAMPFRLGASPQNR